MDEPRADELWARLEGAVLEWQSGIANERRALAERLAETRDRLKALLGDARKREQGDAALAKDILATVQSLRKSLADVETVRAQVAETESRLQARNQEFERLQEELLRTQKALAERSDSSQAAQDKVAELTRACEEAREACRNLEARAKEAERDRDEARNALQSTIAKLEEAQGRFLGADEALQDRERRAQELEQAFETLQSERAELLARTEKAEQEAAERRESEAQLAARLEETEQARQTEAENLREVLRKIEGLEAEAAASREILEHQKGELEAGERVRAELQERAAALEAEVRNAAAAREGLDSELGKARGEIERLRQECEAARQSAAEVQELERLLEVERERAEALGERLQQEIAGGTKTTLAQQLAEALRENEEIRQQLMEARAELRRARRSGAVPPAAESPVEEADPYGETLILVKPENGAGLAQPEGNLDGDEAPEASAFEGEEPIPLPDEEEIKRHRLAEWLLQAGTITREQLAAALQEQRALPDRRLDSILVERGYADEKDVAEAWAHLSGTQVVHLKGNGVDPQAVGLISGRLASLHGCIPLRATQDTLTLAMSNPLDLIAIEDVERASRRRVETVVGLASEIRDAIQRAYA